LAKEDSQKLDEWKKDCSQCSGHFCSVVQVELADRFVEKGKYREPLEIFTNVSHDLGRTETALQYRITALQILNGKPLATVLRTAAPFFEKKTEEIPAAQTETIRSHICTEMGLLPTRQIYQLLKNVYPRPTVVRQARVWISQCDLENSRRISSLAKLTDLKPFERQSLLSAFKVRELREKTIIRETKKSIEDKKIVTKKTLLPGTLSVPLLLPFPEIAWPEAGYQFEETFRRVSEESRAVDETQT
jgi:hypothetical protein